MGATGGLTRVKRKFTRKYLFKERRAHVYILMFAKLEKGHAK